jgi:TPR repeat protein
MNLKSIFIAAVLALLLPFSVAHAKGDANTVKAAELGLAEAQYKLGEWYEAGRGVEQSDANELPRPKRRGM